MTVYKKVIWSKKENKVIYEHVSLQNIIGEFAAVNETYI